VLLKTVVYFCCLLASCAAIAGNEYQHTIDEVAPGYKILTNEEMFVDEKSLKNFLSADEIKSRNMRKSLGIIEGRFNQDKFLDFAALVVNRSIKEITTTNPVKGKKNDEDKFAAALVVCLGTKESGKYDCEILPTLWGSFINLPYQNELILFKPKKHLQCGSDDPIPAYFPAKSAKNAISRIGTLPAQKILLNYDGIGEYAIGRNFGRTLIRRADQVYLDCADED
jgi:hypothetical protein